MQHTKYDIKDTKKIPKRYQKDTKETIKGNYQRKLSKETIKESLT